MKKSILILLAVASLFLCACTNNQTNTTQTEATTTDSITIAPVNFVSAKANITVEEALTLSNEGALIIDVRESDELVEVAPPKGKSK